jgi:hypothetical protein
MWAFSRVPLGGHFSKYLYPHRAAAAIATISCRRSSAASSFAIVLFAGPCSEFQQKFGGADRESRGQSFRNRQVN